MTYENQKSSDRRMNAHALKVHPASPKTFVLAERFGSSTVVLPYQGSFQNTICVSEMSINVNLQSELFNQAPYTTFFF